MGWIIGIVVVLVLSLIIFSVGQSNGEHFCQDKYGSAYHLKNNLVSRGFTWCQDSNGNMKASE